MNLRVIIGGDELLVEEAVKRSWPEDAVPEVIDSRTSTNAELQLQDLRTADAAFSTPPFLDPFKATWWRNVHFLPSGGKKSAAAEVKEALEKFAKKLVELPLPENQVFVISGPALLKTSNFAKTLAGAAEMVFLAAPKPWEQTRFAEARVAETAKSLGLAFESGAIAALVARVGTDARSLQSELDKLDAYLGPSVRLARRADVEAIASPGAGVEPEIWSISEAIASRNAEAAMSAVREFEGQSGFAVMVTTVAEKCLRQLYDLKCAEADGTFELAAQGLSPMALRQAHHALPKWTRSELRVARARMMQLRERAVTTSGGSDPLVGLTLLRVILSRSGKR